MCWGAERKSAEEEKQGQQLNPEECTRVGGKEEMRLDSDTGNESSFTEARAYCRYQELPLASRKYKTC